MTKNSISQVLIRKWFLIRRNSGRNGLLGLIVVAFALLFLASPALADILVENVNGYTLRSDGRLFPYQATLDVDIARYGVSGSVTLGDNASIGAGITFYDFGVSSVTSRFNFDQNRPGLYNAPNFGTPPVRQNTQAGEDRVVFAEIARKADETHGDRAGFDQLQGDRLRRVAAAVIN